MGGAKRPARADRLDKQCILSGIVPQVTKRTPCAALVMQQLCFQANGLALLSLRQSQVFDQYRPVRIIRWHIGAR